MSTKARARAEPLPPLPFPRFDQGNFFHERREFGDVLDAVKFELCQPLDVLLRDVGLAKKAMDLV